MKKTDKKTGSREEMRVSDEHSELFHYTSVSALRGILDSGVLWATQASHLNDTTEMKLVWGCLNDRLTNRFDEEFSKLARGNTDFERRIEHAGGVRHVAQCEGEMLANLMRSHLLGDDEAEGAAVPFVFSFTKHGGDTAQGRYRQQNGMLSQWRGYGGSEGVAIVFDTREIEGLLGLECCRFDYFSCYLATVVYDSDGLSLTQEFPKLSDAIQKYSLAWVESDAHAAKESLNKVAPELPIAAGRLKHIAYGEEDECRIVAATMSAKFRQEIENAGLSTGKSAKPVSHREGRYGSIPYIKLFDGLDEDLPIKRIIVGPSQNQIAHEEAIQEMVGGKSIHIQRSGIPFVASV